MTINTHHGSGTPAPVATHSPEPGTNNTFASVFSNAADADRFAREQHVRVWHGGVAQHGCILCPPTPCWCGHDDGICPDAGQHRREHMGSETSWRETALSRNRGSRWTA